MTRAPSGWAAALLVAGVLGTAACGDDEQSTIARPSSDPPPTGAEGDGAVTGDDAPAGEDGTPGGDSGGGDGGGRGPDGDGTGGAAGACRYEAPPGRLGERTIEIEATGVGCGQARRLAVAAALGQPAGANIPIERGGFTCDPSTRERGVDVVYTCSSGSARARFAVSWGQD